MPRTALLVVLLAAAGSLALLTHAAPSRSATTAAAAPDPYHAPLVVDTNPDPKVVETTITAKRATVDVGNGVTAHALTFNGAIPGPTFKLDVRKLKRLGLTVSLEVGYELSPRGRAYLAHLDHLDHLRTDGG